MRPLLCVRQAAPAAEVGLARVCASSAASCVCVRKALSHHIVSLPATATVDARVLTSPISCPPPPRLPLACLALSPNLQITIAINVTFPFYATTAAEREALDAAAAGYTLSAAAVAQAQARADETVAGFTLPALRASRASLALATFVLSILLFLLLIVGFAYSCVCSGATRALWVTPVQPLASRHTQNPTPSPPPPPPPSLVRAACLTVSRQRRRRRRRSRHTRAGARRVYSAACRASEAGGAHARWRSRPRPLRRCRTPRRLRSSSRRTRLRHYRQPPPPAAAARLPAAAAEAGACWEVPGLRCHQPIAMCTHPTSKK